MYQGLTGSHEKLPSQQKAHNSQKDAKIITPQYRHFQHIMEHSKRNRTSSACLQRNNKSFATSCTAIGWASMLFTVSSVHGFSSTRTRIPNAISGSRAEFPGPFDGLNFSPLSRKDSIGDSDETQRQYLTSRRDAFASRIRSTRRYAGSPTQLNYRDGDDHEPQVVRKDADDTEATRWWQSVFQEKSTAPAHENDEEQQVVDDYLEFLDKRYKRLHEKEKKKREPAPKKFSALGWLMADSKSNAIAQQQEDDALFVLGVAELASERLLHKHHASLQYKKRAPALKEEQEVVIDAVAETEPADDTAVVSKDNLSESRKALLFATLAATGRKVLTGASNGRKALIAYQEKKLVAALLAAFKTSLGTPTKAVKLFWNLGGGRKTVALTASAFITAFLLVRPVAQALISEATFSAK